MSLTSDKSKSVQNVAEEENVQNNLSDTTDTDTDSRHSLVLREQLIITYTAVMYMVFL